MEKEKKDDTSRLQRQLAEAERKSDKIDKEVSEARQER